jgi:hypothetical protein
MSHLGDRISALVDGELGHQDRDRALAHVAHCADCRAEVEAQRGVKHLLAGARVPRPDPETIAALHALAAPGGPVPPRARTMPRGPVVPDLPPPGRRPRGGRADSRRPAHRAARRARVVTAGTLSVAGLLLGTAFVAGGSSGSSNGPVVPPVAELSVEHGRTSTAVTVGDPGVGLMTTLDPTGPTSIRR